MTSTNSQKLNRDNTFFNNITTNTFQLENNSCSNHIDFTSGKKDERNFFNNNIGTPAFRLENSMASSRKKNKSSSNKKVEFRYLEEDQFFNSNSNKKGKGNLLIKTNFNNNNCINNTFFDSDFFNKNKISTNDMSNHYRVRSDTDINQKLNFEVINENYQNGKF